MEPQGPLEAAEALRHLGVCRNPRGVYVLGFLGTLFVLIANCADKLLAEKNTWGSNIGNRIIVQF